MLEVFVTVYVHVTLSGDVYTRSPAFVIVNSSCGDVESAADAMQTIPLVAHEKPPSGALAVIDNVPVPPVAAASVI
jgi:hypothetical protein